MMKIHIRFLIFLFALILISSCETKVKSNIDKMIVKGKIEGLRKGKLYLQKIEDTLLVNIDSTLVKGTPNFSFETPIKTAEIFYLYLEKEYCEECIEYVVSMMMEPYDDITSPLIKEMSSEEEKYFNIPTERTVEDLKLILEKKYPDILTIDFSKDENNLNFWFISKNKEEPRLADRFEENGSELEQPLAIARDIKKLYEKLFYPITFSFNI